MKTVRQLFPNPILDDPRANQILRSNLGDMLALYGPYSYDYEIDRDIIFGMITKSLFRYFIFRKPADTLEGPVCRHSIITELRSRGYEYFLNSGVSHCIRLPNSWVDYSIDRSGDVFVTWGTPALATCTFDNAKSRILADRLIEFDTVLPSIRAAADIVYNYLCKRNKLKRIIDATITAMEADNGYMVSKVWFPSGLEDKVGYTICINGQQHDLECRWKSILEAGKKNLPHK